MLRESYGVGGVDREMGVMGCMVWGVCSLIHVSNTCEQLVYSFQQNYFFPLRFPASFFASLFVLAPIISLVSFSFFMFCLGTGACVFFWSFLSVRVPLLP